MFCFHIFYQKFVKKKSFFSFWVNWNHLKRSVYRQLKISKFLLGFWNLRVTAVRKPLLWNVLHLSFARSTFSVQFVKQKHHWKIVLCCKIFPHYWFLFFRSNIITQIQLKNFHYTFITIYSYHLGRKYFKKICL